MFVDPNNPGGFTRGPGKVETFMNQLGCFVNSFGCIYIYIYINQVAFFGVRPPSVQNSDARVCLRAGALLLSVPMCRQSGNRLRLEPIITLDPQFFVHPLVYSLGDM